MSYRKPIKFLACAISVVFFFTLSPRVEALGGSYSWDSSGNIIVSGSPWQGSGTIKSIAGKWVLASDIKANLGQGPCSYGNGPSSAGTLIFSVDTGKNQISFSSFSSNTGSQSCAPGSAFIASGPSNINGSSPGGGTPKPAMPTTCDDYRAVNATLGTACGQGMTYASQGLSAGNTACETDPLGSPDSNGVSKTDLIAACKLGVKLGVAQAFTTQFASIKTAACSGESGGTAASCMSSFDSNLQACVNSANGDLQKVKDCMKTKYPNLASQIDALAATNPDTPACNPDIGIGWLLCPVVNFLAGIADMAKDFVDSSMAVKTTDLLPLSGDANRIWGNMRDIANVLFVVAFLFMIYSQITGLGLSNYSLKKMLPRLIMVAILINASYYICVAAVELSNVIGQSFDNILSGGFDGSITTTPPGGGSAVQGLTGIATAALALGLVYFFLPQAIAVIIYVAFIAMVAAVLLGLRQAIIILLVVISPIAFVMYLLPNTEGIFKKWWGIFKALLFIYPIFGLLYGAGKLAAKLLQSVGGSDAWQFSLFGYVALFSGLLVLPKLLEGALAVGGLAAIVGRMSGKAQNATSGKVQEKYNNSSLAKGREMRKQGRQAWRNKKFAEAMAGEDPSVMGSLRRRFGRGARGIVPFGSHLPSTQKQDYVASRINTSALNQYDKEFEEQVHGAGLTMAHETNQEVASKFDSGKTFESKEHAAAAVDRIMSSGSAEERKKVMAWLGEQKAGSAFDSRSLRSRAVNGAFKRGDSGIYGSGFANKFVDGSVKTEDQIDKEIVKNAADGKLTGQTLVGSDSGTKILTKAIADQRAAGNADAAAAVINVKKEGAKAKTADATKNNYTDSIDNYINSL